MGHITNILKLAISATLFVVLIIWGLHSYIKQSTKEEIYSEVSNIPSSSTAIVLGASVHSNGKLSPILQDRVDTALNLYQQGKVKSFLLSGDHRTDNYNEVAAMKNYLLSRDVPQSRIQTDPGGLDTYESMYRARELFDIKNAIVVTQKFHLPRAIYIAKNLGMDYKGFEANANEYHTESGLIRREKLANIKALLELILKPRPAQNPEGLSSYKTSYTNILYL